MFFLFIKRLKKIHMWGRSSWRSSRHHWAWQRDVRPAWLCADGHSQDKLIPFVSQHSIEITKGFSLQPRVPSTHPSPRVLPSTPAFSSIPFRSNNQTAWNNISHAQPSTCPHKSLLYPAFHRAQWHSRCCRRLRPHWSSNSHHQGD